MHLNVHKAFFMKATIWKQSKCLSADESINKRCVYIYIYIYTTEYYSTIKKNEMLLFAITWVGLESIMLTEIIQRKTNNICYHLYVD